MKREIVAEQEIDAFACEKDSGKDLIDYLYNDHGNACRLIAMYGEDLRYCHAFRKWLVWDGTRWVVDDTDQARRLAKQAMLEGRFRWWPTGTESARTLQAHQAQLLLAAGNPETEAAPVWRKVS